MTRIEFTVPAVPVAQPRPRAVSMNGKARMAGPPKSHAVHSYRATVAQTFAAERPGMAPLDGPLVVRMLFVMPRPGRLRWKTRPMPREPYTAAKNDWDNLGKSTCDALNQIAWRDDGQIVRAEVERWIAAGDEQPHVEIVIESLEA